MKIKSFLGLFGTMAFLAACQGAFAQGQVVLNTTAVSGTVKGVITSELGAVLTAADLSAYRVEVWGAANDNNIANFVLVQQATDIPNNDGKPFTSSTAAVSGTYSDGDPFYYVVRAWKLNSGSAYADASIRGESTPVVFRTLLTDPPSPTTLNNWNSFALTGGVVPEPTTVVLGVMGGLALLLRRRK